MRKKILSLALAVVIGFSSTNVTAFAQESEGKEIETIAETVQETEEVEVEQSTDNEDKEYGSIDTTETEVMTSTEELVEESSTYTEEETETISTTVAEEETIEVVSEEAEVLEEIVREEEYLEEADVYSESSLNTEVSNKIKSYKGKWPHNTDVGLQCLAFANKLAKEVFGCNPGGSVVVRATANGKTVNGWTCHVVTESNMPTVEPGDIIDAPTSDTASHSAMVLSVSGEKIICVQSNIDNLKTKNILVWWGDECSDGHKYFNWGYKRSTLKEIYKEFNGKKGETGVADGKIRVWKPSESLKQNADYYNGGALKISGQSIPSKIKQGQSFSCQGTITSNYKITHVGGYILQFIDGKEHVVYSKTVKPNTTSYSLLNSDVDKALPFGELPAGTYYYKITAHDSSGNKRTLINEPFDVTGTSTLRISGQNYPTNMNVGSSFKSEGIIRSNYNIVHVGCYILKIEDGNETVMYSKTISPNATSFNLDNEEIHNALQFQNLPAGTYYYKITAHDSADKRSNMVNKEFTVDATESTLSISGGTYPGTLTKGTVWNSKGTISSNYNIEHIGCYILQITDGNETVIYSKILKPNATSYNLDNSEVHNSLLFHELPVGNYFYSITAHDISGKRSYMIYQPFSVVNDCEFDNRSIPVIQK